MSLTWIIVGCVIGTIIVGLVLGLTQMITPYILGGLVIAFGIYQGIQVGDGWGWIIGVSSGVGGAISILINLVADDDEESGEKNTPDVQKADDG